MNNPQVAHPSWRIALHWMTVLLIAAGVTIILVRDAFDDRGIRSVFLDLHRNIGLFVLGIACIRLAAAPWMRTAADPMPVWAARCARVMHLGLYALLAAVPIVGWALSSARGQAVSVFDLLPLPALAQPDHDLAEQLEEVHEVLAYTLLAFAFLHAAAALWHHYRRHDQVLFAMLPRSSR
jgi:cytochrome b561